MAEELELAPEPCEPEAEPEVEGCAELELEAPEEGWVVEPEPAEPLMLDEPLPEGVALDELEGAVLDDEDAPPLALSFFWMSTEVDEELEPDGAAVEPEPEGAVVEDELDAPAGARLLSARSQPARTAAPNAMETARARVESFMWPPWLGYSD